MTKHTLSLVRLSALALALGSAAPAFAATVTDAFQVELASQPLDSALTALATQTGLAIGVDAALLRGKSAPALKGRYSAEQALDTVLQGSGLQWHFTGNHSVVVQPAPAPLELGSGPLALSDTLVSATRSEASIASIPGTVQVIQAPQIAQQSAAGRKVADILGTLVPGLSPSSGTMSNYGQTLRGRNVLVLIDGVSQNASRDVSRQLNSVAPSSVERIEVVSGASSLYGAGASGGIINIITKHNEGQPLALSSRVGISSADNFNPKGFAYEAFQSVTGREKAFDWYLSADLLQRNDQFDGNGKRIAQEAFQGSNMDTQSHDLHAKFGFDLNDEQRLSLALQDYEEKQDTGYVAGSRNGESVAIKGLQLSDQPFTHNQAVNLNFSDRDLLGQQLLVESYWRKQQARFFPYNWGANAGVVASQSEARVYGLRTAVESSLPSIGSATGSLVWGADFENEQVSQDGDRYSVDGLVYTPTGQHYAFGPDIETNTTAVFAQSTWDIGDWTVRGGARHEWIHSDVADSIAFGGIWQAGVTEVLPGGTLKYEDTLYNLGTVYHISSAQDVFVNFSQGFSLPDIQRFLRDVRGSYDIQDLNAQAIKVDSYELGWRADWETLQANVTLFENRSDVTQYYDSVTRAQRLIDQKERVRGVETSLTWHLDTAWSVGGTYAWTKGETHQNGEWLDLPATRISPAKTTAFVAFAPNDFDMRLQAMRLESYDAGFEDGNGRKIEGYTTVDLLAGVTLPVGKLQMGIYNLSDRNYETLYMQANAAAPYPHAEGRRLALSYAVDW
ncbi:Ferric aerobactin receptor precursor [compost metagenome]